ncbi:MAG: nuclear transport factor 2 family protein [Gammaproteobacteria bacterium]|nr:nuclear transport factor 2 family protein [Gammaproteobacteria bacterium]
MTTNYKDTWETYVSSWKISSSAEKRALFKQCLDAACRYNDPLIATEGWDALEAYMQDFHRQLPGGHFVTTYFLAHNNKSIARWEMRSGENVMLGDGISYGEYNQNGKLVSMTGFFEPPRA